MFKIRKKIYPKLGSDVFEERYSRFLKKHIDNIDDNLMRLFGNDSFHDGNLQYFNYNLFCNALDIRLSCPNYLNEANEYVNIDYSIKFRDVSCCCIKQQSGFSAGYNLSDAIFLHSELGTLVSPKKKQSIIMQFCSEGGLFYIMTVFCGVMIQPVEPVAFMVLQQKGKLIAPAIRKFSGS